MLEHENILMPSAEGREIYTRVWSGEAQKAIVLIAHGMSEHGGRYSDFAAFLARHGYVVCIGDHMGHGHTAGVKGYFGETGGVDRLIGDLRILHERMKQLAPEAPCFLLGHSMGSFLARKYMAAYGDDLAGCILSGTMGPGKPIQKKLKGGKSVGKLLSGISFGSHNKRIEHPVNRCAWLSTVDRVCIDYVEDPHCGFYFTAAGYYDLFSVLKEVNAPGWAALVPKDLPVYLFSGEADPVGDYGKGPQQVFGALKSAGLTDVELKLYPEGRHEMLNEVNRSEVYDDVLRWLEERAIFSGWPFRGTM